MGRRALLFGVGAGAAACIACTAILGDFEPTAGTGPGDGGDGGGTDAVADSSDAGQLGGFLATSVSAGEHHTCAVRDGRVFCWGGNAKGQLGQSIGAFDLADHPVKISALGEAGGIKGMIAVAAGYNHTCALSGEGTVFCWGANDRGQVGNSTMDLNPHPDPAQVVGVDGAPGFLHNVIAIAAGERHTCAVTTSTVVCWGDNIDAQSGNPALALQFSAPHDIGGSFMAARNVTTGPKHTCASNGTAFTCWGTQASGELGLNADGGPPVVVVGGTTPAITGAGGCLGAIGAGEFHTCAQTLSGAACWGKNTSGQVGAADAGSFFVPTPVANLAAVESVVTGSSHSCALMKDKTVSCWGSNLAGQLGQGAPLADVNFAPKPAVGLAGVTSLSAGISHTCAVVGARAADGGVGPGQVFCWGTGRDFRLGIGPTIEDQPTPKLVSAER
jgi:alpha-tubulin suppressor-like RCC1 family protein